MDNSQSSVSENVVNSEEIKAPENQVFEAKAPVVTPEVKEVKEDKRVPLHELYKERNRRKAAEEELGKLRSRVDELDSKFSKVSQAQDDDELVAEAEKELGIDKEAARKLLNFQKKVAEKVAPKQQVSNTVNDPVLRAMDDFKRRAAESSQDYEDWNDMIPAMQAVMSKEIEQNGIGAYNKSPEYYYSKALKAQKQVEQKIKKEESIDKANTAEMAVTESSGSSTRSVGTKITQAVWDANKSNRKWIDENRDEIIRLHQSGVLKRT